MSDLNPKLPHQPDTATPTKTADYSLVLDDRPLLNDEINFNYTMDQSSSSNPGKQPAVGVSRAVTRPPPPTGPMQQSFAQEISLQHEKTFYEHWMIAVGNLLGAFGQVPLLCCCPNPMVAIPQGFVGLISTFGKYYKTVDPGLCKVNVLTEEIRKLDVKIQITEIPRQDIMTKDNVCLSIDSVVYWIVCDPYKAAYGITDARIALIERTQTTLRQTLGVRVLQDVIENRDVIGEEIARIIDIPAHTWGIRIESILFKDLQFGRELQESLASAATQKRIGESKIIAARAEVEAAKLMREASDILNTKAAMQIRYLDTLREMSKGNGSKIIFMPLSQEDSHAEKGSRPGGVPHNMANAAIMDKLSEM